MIPDLKRILFRLALLGCLLPGMALTAHPLAGADRPNVLMIIVDDLNDWVGVLGGHPNAHTPNLDRLAAQGTLFTNAHATAAICGPSRASVMTGLSPTTSGIYDQLHDKQIRQAGPATRNVVFLTEYFGQQGYKTMGIGKIFHESAPDEAFEQYGGRVKGFGPHPPREFVWESDLTNTDWGVFPDRNEDMIDHQSAAWTVERLGEEHNRPFFLTVGFIRPHAPWYTPQEWFDLHPVTQLTMPPYRENDLDDVSQISRDLHDMPMMPTTEWAIETNEWPNIVQAYLASVSFVDHYVGEVLNALDSSPYAGNTIVILWSDHGYHIGEKNRFAKHSLWEESTRVPLMIRAPGGEAGRTEDSAVSLLDIYPTLLDLAGLPPYGANEGTSLRSSVLGGEQGFRQYAVTSYGYGNHAVRGKDFRYIRYRDGSEELYDHRRDPNEWTNLAHQPELEPVKQRLQRVIPATAAPLSPVHYGRPTNAHFEALFNEFNIETK
jgi:arylsulfatase A-like enzyme